MMTLSIYLMLCRSHHESALLLKDVLGAVAGVKSPILSCAIVLTLSLGALSFARADSATWNLNPVDNDWNHPANWTPATVPNGPSDVATFGISNETSVRVSTGVVLDKTV